MGDIDHCGSCGNKNLDMILDLGAQPLAERMGSDAVYPLVLVQCTNCSLLQLSYQIDPREVFPQDHPYATGDTAFLVEHFRKLAVALKQEIILQPGDNVVDIGANDGTLLSFLPEYVTRIAVEPTGQGEKAKQRGLKVFPEFFSDEVANEIAYIEGGARIVTANNVFAHVPDPHDFLQGVVTLLRSSGIFVTENHDASSILRGLQVDTIYHEHLRYYTAASLSYLLAMHGLEVFRVEPVPTHGGSFRTWARLQPDTADLADRVHDSFASLWALLAAAHREGKVYGIGATTRATPLIHGAGIKPFIDAICEVPGNAKIGQFLPGTRIPVIEEKHLFEEQPPHALMLSWHIAESIMPKLRKSGYRGKFIIPLPVPHTVELN
jgi:2-polyprenyl-3-methyl-5-hydroxy-6-metoxy-1,4-benzoquinol methylase